MNQMADRKCMKSGLPFFCAPYGAHRYFKGVLVIHVSIAFERSKNLRFYRYNAASYA